MIYLDNHLNVIKDHVINEYPKEAVGYLINDCYVPMENKHPDPENHFSVSTWPYSMNVRAVIHSHPSDRPCPSADDMKFQLVTKVPWFIFVTDGKIITKIIEFGDELNKCPAFLGREFVHGVTDCYGLVRDWFMGVHGIVLPQFPRDNEWWDNGEDLLNKSNFIKAGFVEIKEDQLTAGDVIIFRIGRCPVPNHCGVYTGNGKILHHLYNRYSQEEEAHRWLKKADYFLRYSGK